MLLCKLDGYFIIDLSIHKAAAYLGIAEDGIIQLLESGQLDSAIYKMGDNYIISKQALQEWAETKVAE